MVPAGYTRRRVSCRADESVPNPLPYLGAHFLQRLLQRRTEQLALLTDGHTRLVAALKCAHAAVASDPTKAVLSTTGLVDGGSVLEVVEAMAAAAGAGSLGEADCQVSVLQDLSRGCRRRGKTWLRSCPGYERGETRGLGGSQGLL